jgi:hypothetical protein
MLEHHTPKDPKLVFCRLCLFLARINRQWRRHRPTLISPQTLIQLGLVRFGSVGDAKLEREE